MKRVLGKPLPKCAVCGANIRNIRAYETKRYCSRACADKRRGEDMRAAKAKAEVVA
jgi:hypothetical protein